MICIPCCNSWLHFQSWWTNFIVGLCNMKLKISSSLIHGVIIFFLAFSLVLSCTLVMFLFHSFVLVSLFPCMLCNNRYLIPPHPLNSSVMSISKYKYLCYFVSFHKWIVSFSFSNSILVYSVYQLRYKIKAVQIYLIFTM